MVCEALAALFHLAQSLTSHVLSVLFAKPPWPCPHVNVSTLINRKKKAFFQHKVAKRTEALAHYDVALTRIFTSWPHVFKIALKEAFKLSNHRTKLSIISANVVSMSTLFTPTFAAPYTYIVTQHFASFLTGCSLLNL